MEDTKVPYPGIVPEELPVCVAGVRWDGLRVTCPEQDNPHVLPPTRIYHLWYQVPLVKL